MGGSATIKPRAGITEKAAKFIANAKLGMPLGRAAREAGYSDGAHEVDRLLARPEVRAQLIDALQRQAVRWPQMLTMALANLWDVICPRKVLCEKTCECGRKCENEVYIPNDTDTRLKVYTSKIVLDTLSKSGMADTLRTRAEKEDEGTKEEIADRILGKRQIIVAPAVPILIPVKPDGTEAEGTEQ